tara:strand:+ start:995 stop:1210 length:216 start_codon:yes stop_codon:yes gene_type:complete
MVIKLKAIFYKGLIMQLSNKEKYIKQESLRARCKELSSKILTQQGKIVNANKSIIDLKIQQEKLEREFIQL